MILIEDLFDSRNTEVRLLYNVSGGESVVLDLLSKELDVVFDLIKVAEAFLNRFAVVVYSDLDADG